MNCRELLCISILIFCTTTNAAPSTPSKWLQLANESKFQQYKSTLLSMDVMPFLSACYEPKCCSSNDEYRCNLYFDAVFLALQMNALPNVTRELMETISPQPVADFCTALSSTYAEISSKFGHKIPFDAKSNTQIACIIGCGDLEVNTLPPCRVSLWLLNLLNTAAKQVQANALEAKELQAKETQTKKVQESAPQSENVAAESKSVDAVPPVEHETPKAEPSPNEVTKETAEKTSTHVAPSGQTSPTKPQRPTLTEEKDAEIPKPLSVAAKNTEKKSTTKEPTPSGVDPGNEDIESAIKPMVGTKTTTETPAAGPGPNQGKKEPSILDPGMDDYDDEMMTSNENKPNSVDQMEDLNEPDESLAKVESEDNGRTQRVDPDIVIVDGFKDEPASNFFFYFLFGMFAVIVAYVVYNNKSKLVALVLEGRRAQGGRGRRKHTAAYRKLDSNLEEAIMSAPSGRTTQVIY